MTDIDETTNADQGGDQEDDKHWVIVSDDTGVGPDVKFPPMPDPPPGVVMRITVERLGGVGPWAPPRT